MNLNNVEGCYLLLILRSSPLPCLKGIVFFCWIKDIRWIKSNLESLSPGCFDRFLNQRLWWTFHHHWYKTSFGIFVRGIELYILLHDVSFDILFINQEKPIAFDISTTCEAWSWNINGNWFLEIDKSDVQLQRAVIRILLLCYNTLLSLYLTVVIVCVASLARHVRISSMTSKWSLQRHVVLASI